MQSTTKDEIFQTLPRDLIHDQILCFLNKLELIFTLREVSHFWRELLDEYLLQYYKKDICRLFKINTGRQGELTDFNFNSGIGRKFIKYLLRKEVYEFSCKLFEISQQSEYFLRVEVKAPWVDEELQILQGYFNRYSDLQEKTEKYTSQPENGFFGSVISFIGSFFSNNSTSSTTSSSDNSTSSSKNSSKQSGFNVVAKILLDGYCGSGKTSLLNCVTTNTPVNPASNYVPCIGNFIRSINLGESSRIKLQFFDTSGADRFKSITSSYYKHSPCIFLMVDPYSEDSCNVLQNRLESIRWHAPKAEVIFITTKKDLSGTNERVYSNEQADEFAFENFGGIHLDITCTQLKEPNIVAMYGSLLVYFLSNKSL